MTELGVSERIHRFTPTLDVWRPSGAERHRRPDRCVGFVREETDLRLGIEADYVRGTRTGWGTCSKRHESDYVLGSVRFLGEFVVDFDDGPTYGVTRTTRARLERYFEAIAGPRRPACSTSSRTRSRQDLGLGRPSRPGPALLLRARDRGDARRRRRDEGLDPGLRRPIGRSIRRAAMLEMAVDAGMPIALSSDAHRPEHLAYGYKEAVELLEGRGVRGVAVFEKRDAPDGAAQVARTGLGIDSHRFAAGRRLILGGVEIPHEGGLDGHSDADVLAHAITDAILGAASMGDIGTHFPDTDEQWRGRGLDRVLREIVRRVGAGLARRARRRHRDARAAETRAAPGGDHRPAVRGRRRLGARQGDDRRADGLRRARRGRGRDGRRHARPNLKGTVPFRLGRP